MADDNQKLKNLIMSPEQQKIVEAVNFALQKYLLKMDEVEQEEKILAKEIDDLETKIKLQKITKVINKQP